MCQIISRTKCLLWLCICITNSPLAAAPDEFTATEPLLPEAKVPRAQFATAVVEREPIDQVVTLDTDHDQVYFFTELKDLQGRTVMHRWEYEGRVLAEVSFDVGGPRWRVYSSKSLTPDMVGEWVVTVVDQSGWPLRAGIFRYTQAAHKQAARTAVVPPPDPQ